MAPLQGTKRAHDDGPEEEGAKRLQVSAEAGEAEAFLQELAEEDSGDEGSEVDAAFLGAAWLKEDFSKHREHPVELSDEQLAAFNAAFQEAQSDWNADDGRVLVMGNPVDVRPVPQTTAELKERLATFRLSDYGMAQRMTFDDELDEAMLGEDEEEEDKDDEATEDGEAEAEADPPAGDAPQRVLRLLQSYTKAAEQEKDAAQALQVAVVVTHGLLDAEIGDLLDDEALKAELVAALGSLAKVWQTLLAKPSAELGVEDADRRGAEELVKMIRQSLDDDTFNEGKLKGTFVA